MDYEEEQTDQRNDEYLKHVVDKELQTSFLEIQKENRVLKMKIDELKDEIGK